ncbi:glycosyltransferase family 4 protein [Amaricoccus macauensis]|uniref:glycosyltransferase family 4 protein n=1 Tax=Amaricoccus macauensis TaxID=57001 RepID=UPI003C7D2665
MHSVASAGKLPDDAGSVGLRRASLAGLKVLHVCETAKGGIATYFNVLSSIGKQDRIRNVFVTPSRHTEYLDDDLDKVTYTAPDRGILPTFRLIWSTIRASRSLRPDIVFAHSTFTLPVLAALRTIGLKSKIIYCSHGWAAQQYEPGTFRHRVATMVERHLPSLADSIICISSSEQDFARDNGYKGNFVVIDNCVMDAKDAARDDAFGSEDDPRIHLLFVGRFDRQKGIDLLQEAFVDILKERQDIVLHLVGGAVVNGAEEDGVLPESANVVRHGWVANSDIDSYFRSADAIIVPSRWEAFGLVVAEAFRNGTPALVSDRGAPPSFIEEGQTGHVFHLSAASIRDTLSGLKKKDLRAMRKNARQAFEDRHTVARFREKIDNLYLALVG